MTAAVIFRHQGVLCVLPARQVIDREERGGRRQINLFEPMDAAENVDGAARRSDGGLLVHTPGGIAWLPCTDCGLERLRYAQTHSLPPIVADGLALPHLVGMTETPKGVAWMVDLRRFRTAATATRSDNP